MPGPGKPGQPKRFTNEELAERNRTAMRERRRTQTRAGQEIGDIPAVVDPVRRKMCEPNLAMFCETYLPWLFQLPFCDDHHAVIAKAEQSITHSGLFAVAMPRGSGKTTVCRAASLWAILYGYRRFVFIVGATVGHAKKSLLAIKAMMLRSETLLEDFPEAIFPMRALDGEARSQGGQRQNGVRTQIFWGMEHLIFPRVTVPSKSAGAIIAVSGITGADVRGPNVDGQRPDLLIVDDPQTNKSAKSESQCADREEILQGMAIGMGGPGKRIAGIMPCTVIRAGDMADCVLNHEKHPEWDSERTKMVYSFPTKTELWEKYREILYDYNPNLGAFDRKRAREAATLFYLDHADEMREGARVAWAHRFDRDEMDGLQHAMNLLFQDKRAFHAEYQNEPLPVELGDVVEMTALEIAAKVNRVPRDVVPLGASRLTAFIDVQQRLLYYVVCAWAENFTGWVIDYGTYPDQKRRYFTLADATKTLNKLEGFEKGGVEAQVFAGLDQLTKGMLGMEWKGETGATHRVERCLVDSGWNSELVYHFCRRSQYAQVLLPSKGEGRAASNIGITDHKKKPGERIGLEWYLPVSKETRGVRLLHYDTYFWKSFLMARLAVPIGGKGALTLFGDDTHAHRMLADHLTSEYRIRVGSLDPKRSGRVVDEWKLKPGSPDNHLFDCAVGCAVAASFQGVSLADVHKSTKPVTLAPVDYAAQYAKARAGG
jgi:hypothetical protein